jgi:hypothetical protein
METMKQLLEQITLQYIAIQYVSDQSPSEIYFHISAIS